MSDSHQEILHRLYPIGAFSESEVVEILQDPRCAEGVSVDELMQDWQAKSRAFENKPISKLDALDTELLSFTIRKETMAKVEAVIKSYRDYFPPTFGLALVPIEKLISPQRSITWEHARESLGGAEGRLSDDEIVSLCLGSPIPPRHVEASYLGSPKSSAPNRFDSVYQFSSDDPNLRYVPMMPSNPVRDINLGTQGAPFSYDVKAVPVAVGIGLSVVHVLKVATGVDPETRVPTSKLIILNGVHRIFRLAELGHTHVAAMIQTIKQADIPNPLIDTPRDQLFVPRPLTILDFTDGAVSRRFKWRKSKRIVKLQVTVTQETSFVL